MVKAAMHSAIEFADNPRKVMKHLAQVIGSQLQGQFITTAYLFIDLTTGKACYSAAGHPPVFYWNRSNPKLETIQSNGLLISALMQDEYPAIELNLKKGDRFLLYTDGLTEAENKNGEQFGDRKLQEVLKANKNIPLEELSSVLNNTLKIWIADPGQQQDDFTWVIIDVL